MFVSIPWLSSLLNTLEQLLLRLDGYLIVEFKIGGIQATPNIIYVIQLFSNRPTSCQALAV